MEFFKPHFLFILIFFSAYTLSCSGSVESSSDSLPTSQTMDNFNEWIIPKDEVLDGGPGLDGIPSIDDPRFAPANTIEYISDERLVVGIKMDDTLKAYPHEVLDHHEIVNDRIGDRFFSLTYCPLTGTAIAWKRDSDMEFGVTGLIYRNNLIPYDRSTGSRYSQMQMRAVKGSRSGSGLVTKPVLQLPWAVWKTIYPESKVLTTNTGYERDYSLDLYSKDYRDEDSETLFPIKNEDSRLPKKEIVHGVIWGTPADEEARVRVYEIDEFGSGIHLVEDTFAGGNIIVAGSTDKQFAVSFLDKSRDGTELKFEAVQNSLPVIMKDQEGNRWDLFGYAVEGPRKGERLWPTNSYTGYWFAWADFFPELELYQFQNQN